ncbi:Animal haem peroxidase [Lentzea fradiae]|uniref:Animal haem peroxidase n=1 Tax=Lentzea fradiae TaxID=200378 RepID=A0A1G7R964_9PSEU|nr:heme peroxidase family protein [Lentzea fradiae]SDG07346.1 Animal haem peroxidase [Lentzea fradiae]
MKRHVRDSFFVVGEGVLEFDDRGEASTRQPSTLEELRRFRFSRLGPKGPRTDEEIRVALASAITAAVPQADEPAVPAGFTYLGQFVDHDLTMDRTDTQLGQDVNLDELLQGRSPALDLDSVYGRGPRDKDDQVFYDQDGVKLKTGTTTPVPFPDEGTNVPFEGFDLPRRGGTAGTAADRRLPLIPDARNDENLVVAQTHLAFIRFHNRVVDELALTGLSGERLFRAAKELVVRHYQWMLKTDFLPRVVDPAIVDDVFTNGRRFFEVPGKYYNRDNSPTMPIEFSVASYRFGHSQVRGAYQWNRVFNSTGPGGIASLFALFTFTGVAGNFDPSSQTPADLDDVDRGPIFTLPSNWIADFRRLYDFTEAERDDLAAPQEFGGGNVTKRIDTLLVNPLTQLPAGTFGGRGTTFREIERNLAFRNLSRASMMELATGQQLAELFGVEPLTAEQILTGNGGAVVEGLSQEQRAKLVAETPLWFYVLREAEVGVGRLGGVGGRITAEVFHRAIEGSRISIVRSPYWRPTLGPDASTFRMVDLLLFAFEGKADLLNPLGDPQG